MESWLHRGRSRRRVRGIERRLESRSIGLAFNDEVVGGVPETIDGALREQHVVEHREPLGRVSIARDDHRRAPRALEEKLVDVFALLLGHGLERKVVKDQEVHRGERYHLGVARVVEATLTKTAQRLVTTREPHVVAVAASDVAEGVRR